MTFWRYRVIGILTIPFALIWFVNCSTKTFTVAFRDIDDSFSFGHDTRLIVKLGNSHPDHLLIFSPEGYVYYFYYKTDINEEVVFENELFIDPKRFKGTRHEEYTGEQIEEVVFSTPGKYVLYFADNTETEPENTFSLERSITFE